MEFTIKSGDTKPLRVILKRNDGRPIPLTNAGWPVAVLFTRAGAVSGLPTVSGACAVLEGLVIPPGDDEFEPTDPTRVFGEGVVEFAWVPGQTDTVGLYRCTWRITDAAGDVETVPNKGWFSLTIE